MISPDVEFCGYSVPHPSEDIMNVRIQTYSIRNLNKDTPSDKVIIKGLTRVSKMCDIIIEKFEESLNKFKKKNKMDQDS